MTYNDLTMTMTMTTIDYFKLFLFGRIMNHVAALHCISYIPISIIFSKIHHIFSIMLRPYIMTARHLNRIL